jgi:hypothetical protein
LSPLSGQHLPDYTVLQPTNRHIRTYHCENLKSHQGTGRLQILIIYAVDQMNEDEQGSRIISGKPEGNRPLGRLHRCDDEIECEGVVSI